MYKETIKTGLISLICISALSSCDSNGEKPAAKLLEEAKECSNAGQFAEAMVLIDSLNKTYPGAVKARRESTALMPEIMEKATLAELSVADSMVAVLQLQGDSLKNGIEYVNNPIEGYYVGKEAKGIDPNSTAGLHGRLSPDGRFYIIATSPKAVKSTSVSVSVNGLEAVTSTVKFDGERNDRSNGREIITFIEAECDTIGKLIAKYPGNEVTATFHGTGSAEMKLPSKQVKAIVDLYSAAAIIRESKLAQLRKSKT